MLRNIMKALWLCVFYLFQKVSQQIRRREIENDATIKISDDIPGIFHLIFFLFPFVFFILSLSLSLSGFSLSSSSFVLSLTSFELTKSSSVVQKTLLRS